VRPSISRLVAVPINLVAVITPVALIFLTTAKSFSVN
jgi:hypothetical protein